MIGGIARVAFSVVICLALVPLRSAGASPVPSRTRSTAPPSAIAPPKETAPPRGPAAPSSATSPLREPVPAVETAPSSATAQPSAASAPSATSEQPATSPPAATPAKLPTPSATPSYTVLYDVRVVPTEKSAHVSIQVQDPGDLLESIDLRIDTDRHVDFSGDGTLEVRDGRVTWQPPRRGGKLRYRFRIDHLRDERSYDARIRDSWAIFRGDDLVPPARVRATKGAQTDAALRLRVPEGWAVVAPFERRDDDTFAIEDSSRRFDRPRGWIGVGRLGVARETIADTRIAIAGPLGQSFRRQDLLALLRWNLPKLRETLPSLPTRLVILGAGDPMWRGGLSGTQSLFIHADRPSISEDGTSPLLHELVHVALGRPSGPGGDWIVEGLAELYSLETLMRSGTLGRRRYERALARFESKGRAAKSLRVDHAGAVERARAVVVLRELHATLDETTAGRVGLDDVVRELAREDGPITTESLREAAERVSRSDLEAFFARPELAPSS
jgi:hypothetical protein